jgi:23S rRNA U2552 (ribose-2'-O)-methylase RlmE/FtsJ
MSDAHHRLFHKWLLVNEEKTTLKINTKKKYRFKQLDKLKEKLDASKSKLDKEYARNKFSTYWSNCDPFKYEKQIVAKIGCTFNVSNAWLKCFELINAFKLVDHIKTANDHFIHFDNAAFPGSFIIATQHLVETLYPEDSYKYCWKASSLLTKNEQDSSPLEDKYKLFENYKNNWLMNENNNGDVLVEANQLDFQKQLPNNVDLYTSDIGFDVSSDYNNQEKMQHQINIGQILSGLLTLKKGGSFITKQFTTIEPTTIAIMYATAAFFDEFYLCKPYTSRMANSETYLVGKGFKGLGTKNNKHPYIKAMFDKITGASPIEVPIFDAKQYSDTYITTIVKSVELLTESQVNKLDSDVDRCRKCLNGRFNGPIKNDPIITEFYESIEHDIIEWYKLNPILPIDKKLNMINALGQN